jgi:hypothetical protein
MIEANPPPGKSWPLRQVSAIIGNAGINNGGSEDENGAG